MTVISTLHSPYVGDALNQRSLTFGTQCSTAAGRRQACVVPARQEDSGRWMSRRPPVPIAGTDSTTRLRTPVPFSLRVLHRRAAVQPATGLSGRRT